MRQVYSFTSIYSSIRLPNNMSTSLQALHGLWYEALEAMYTDVNTGNDHEWMTSDANADIILPVYGRQEARTRQCVQSPDGRRLGIHKVFWPFYIFCTFWHFFVHIKKVICHSLGPYVMHLLIYFSEIVVCSRHWIWRTLRQWRKLWHSVPRRR